MANFFLIEENRDGWVLLYEQANDVRKNENLYTMFRGKKRREK